MHVATCVLGSTEPSADGSIIKFKYTDILRKFSNQLKLSFETRTYYEEKDELGHRISADKNIVLDVPEDAKEISVISPGGYCVFFTGEQQGRYVRDLIAEASKHIGPDPS